MKLDEKFIANQKEKLEARRADILKALNSDSVPQTTVTNDFEVRFPEYGDKEEDNAAEVADYSETLTMEKNLQISLFNVNKALKKISEGNYGLCEKCNNPIDIKRLEAFASATSCMDCKRKGE